MVAKRIIDDHEELENIGTLKHDQIDSVVIDTPFLVLSGSDAALTSNSRKLVAGSGIEMIDSGPSGDLTISSTTTEYIFTEDLQVSLAGGRTFGRYASEIGRAHV